MIVRSVFLFVFAVLLSACGGGYKTDFPPPTGEEKYSDILPTEIGGVPYKGSQLEVDPALYYGSRFNYGSGASITMLQAKDQDALDQYVNDAVKPLLENYSSKVSGKFNDRWSLRGKGSWGRIYGWQNKNYFFVIEAVNDDLFDEVVENFPFISK